MFDDEDDAELDLDEDEPVALLDPLDDNAPGSEPWAKTSSGEADEL